MYALYLDAPAHRPWRVILGKRATRFIGPEVTMAAEHVSTPCRQEQVINNYKTRLDGISRRTAHKMHSQTKK